MLDVVQAMQEHLPPALLVRHAFAPSFFHTRTGLKSMLIFHSKPQNEKCAFLKADFAERLTWEPEDVQVARRRSAILPLGHILQFFE